MTQQIDERAGSAIVSLCLCVALLALGGCGQTAKPAVSPAAGSVDTYFGGPFSVAGSVAGRGTSSFDHVANQIGVSAFVTNSQSNLVPTQVLNGSFTSANTGFLAVSENFVTSSSGNIIPQNPPLSGAWAVEIPGAGALANLLTVNNSTTPPTISAAPAAMADNSACPNSPIQTSFLYVNIPNTTNLSSVDTSNYGLVSIATEGSAVTFSATPYLVGPVAGSPSTVAGGCSVSTLGALTSYPLNSYAQPTNVELISIGKSGLLVSSFNAAGGQSTVGAFGGGNGVVGVEEPSSPVDVSIVVNLKYNGFIYAPKSASAGTAYDITVLASAFGNHAGDSAACSALQTSILANHGQGAGTIASVPFTDTIYGGEFLSVDASGNKVNDPSGQLGSENCDVAVTLGIEDPNHAGLFPNATIFIGSNYPPFSTTNPWNCPSTGAVCAVSFPAAAVVGQVQGQFVILVVATPNSNPPAQLPNAFGSPIAQPVGIYLFQKQ